MKRNDYDAAYEYALNIPLHKSENSLVTLDKFNPTDEWDFGGEETIYARLIRIYSIPLIHNVENMYGTYLGKHGDVYVVAVTKRKDMDDFFFCEEFESLDELKEEWMIRL